MIVLPLYRHPQHRLSFKGIFLCLQTLAAYDKLSKRECVIGYEVRKGE